MIFICILILIFGSLRLLTAGVNFFTFRYLPSDRKGKSYPKVSVLIPARNEAQNIGQLLLSLINFSYPNLEFIVYNDQSEDNTIEIVKEYADKSKQIAIIQGDEVPEPWLGKNHACHQLATFATGDVLLFLDADVRVGEGVIERALNHMQKYDLQLLSIFPKQYFKSAGEKISVPLMNWILLSFLPLILVRVSRNKSFSAANGQFMMFRSETYKSVWPHRLFKNHRVEDIAIIRHYKSQGLHVDTLLGDDSVACRMYESRKEAVEGFTKNIFQFFGNSIFITIIVGLLTTFAPVILFFGMSHLAGIIYVMSIILIRIFISLASKQPVFMNLLYMIPQHLVFLFIIAKGIIYYKKRELIWKGRNILH